jgi:hypothetical protein
MKDRNKGLNIRINSVTMVIRDKNMATIIGYKWRAGLNKLKE